MKAPFPERGSVIHYAYLWAREAELGIAEGRKDRPSLVIALSVIKAGKIAQVFAAAITHSPPQHPGDAMEVPLALNRSLGLDSAPAWIVTTEANAFVWPGPDIRPVPDRPPGTLIYGRVPQKLLEKAIRSFLENRNRARSQIVNR